MRELAACYAGHRLAWRATYLQDTIPPGGGTHVYLLGAVRTTSGVEVMDHAWIKATPAMREARPSKGQIVTFSAVVRRYTRNNGTQDYGLFEVEEWRHGRKR